MARTSPDSARARRTGRVLRGYGLQPGADGEPVVVPGGPGRSVPCDLPGAAGSRVPGSGVRGGLEERETTASSIAGKH